MFCKVNDVEFEGKILVRVLFLRVRNGVHRNSKLNLISAA